MARRRCAAQAASVRVVVLVVAVVSLNAASCFVAGRGGHDAADATLRVRAAMRSERCRAASTPWLFSMHGGDIQYNLTTAGRAFKLMANAGACGVRTDMFWSDIQPTAAGGWDAAKVDFYLQYYQLASSHGLAAIVILSGPPPWATALHSANASAFYVAWQQYAAKVAAETLTLSPAPTMFQLWNEVNALADLSFLTDGCQLLTSSGAVMRAAVPGALLMVNVMADIPFWGDWVTQWATCAGKYIDVLGVDHYPGTWALEAWDDWSPLSTVVARCNNQSDVLYGTAPAVLETGYSTWSRQLANDADQVAWINASLPALRKVVDDSASEEYRVALLNYYELVDMDTGGHESVIPEENDFGVVDSRTLAPKPAYEALAAQIAMF